MFGKRGLGEISDPASAAQPAAARHAASSPQLRPNQWSQRQRLLRQRKRRRRARPRLSPAEPAGVPLGSLLPSFKSTIFNALIETIDLSAARAARSGSGARGNSRHRQRNHLDQERRHVDRRAGQLCSMTFVTTCSVMARLSRFWRATTSPTSWSMAPSACLSKSAGKVSTDRHSLPRQCPVDEHLPTHRQPSRPAR